MLIISNGYKENYNAGPKAPRDVNDILQSNYSADLATFSIYSGNNLIFKFLNLIKKDLFLLKYWNYKDLIIVQMPFSLSPLFRLFVATHTCILLIHDLVGLRYGDAFKEKIELKIYKNCRYIVSHNSKMTQYLKKSGVISSTIVDLNLFDYLCNPVTHKTHTKLNNPIVAYTGNINKAPFVTELKEEKMNFDLYLYGVSSNNEFSKKIKYIGKTTPEKLPDYVIADLGLVWDGDATCQDADDPLKKYTKYNNPHKLSCYLAAGLPVIVWEESAVADFVKRNNIGYLISNIYDINKIKMDDYKTKRENALKIGEKLREGYYTKQAINKLLKRVDEENE